MAAATGPARGIRVRRPVREAVVREVELSDPAAHLDPAEAAQVLVVAKLHGHPVGTVLVDRATAAVTAAWRAEVRRHHGSDIAHHLERDGLTDPSGEGSAGRAASDLPPAGSATTPCRVRLERALRSGPPVTVGIATRGRPQSLARCLDSVLAGSYPRTRVVVCDNAPPDDATATLIRARYAGRVAYVVEPRPGLAVAHNRILQVTDTPLVAFTDDDVVVDRGWVASIVASFGDHPEAGAVTGLIVPDQLDTPAQMLLERHGDFAKGFTSRVFDLGPNRPADRFFPFTAGQLGSGANMAFDTRLLRDVGGFDDALGAGTRAKGGDDLAALFAVVAHGRQVVYEPSAMLRHRHRRTVEALERQAFGYGMGLGAYLTGAMARHPRLALRVARELPAGLRFAFSSASARNRDRYEDWPPALARKERLGLALGPLAYTASWLTTRRRA